MARHIIIHIEFPVTDRGTAEQFYGQLFGWQFTHYPDQAYSTFDTGAVSGALNLLEDALTRPGQPLIYVSSQDVESDLQRAEALGGEIVVPKTPIPGVGWYGVFADPEGNRIGLLSIPGR